MLERDGIRFITGRSYSQWKREPNLTKNIENDSVQVRSYPGVDYLYLTMLILDNLWPNDKKQQNVHNSYFSEIIISANGNLETLEEVENYNFFFACVIIIIPLVIDYC